MSQKNKQISQKTNYLTFYKRKKNVGQILVVICVEPFLNQTKQLLVSRSAGVENRKSAQIGLEMSQIG